MRSRYGIPIKQIHTVNSSPYAGLATQLRTSHIPAVSDTSLKSFIAYPGHSDTVYLTYLDTKSGKRQFISNPEFRLPVNGLSGVTPIVTLRINCRTLTTKSKLNIAQQVH